MLSVVDSLVFEAAPPLDAAGPATLELVAALPGPVVTAVVPLTLPVNDWELLVDVLLLVAVVLPTVSTVTSVESDVGGHSSSPPLQS